MIRTDEDVSEGGQALSELLDLSLVGLDLLALSVLGATLLLGVESQVLQEDNLAISSLVDNGLNLWANTVWSKLDLLATEELLELWDDWLQGVLWVDLAVWATKVGHEDNSLGAIVDGVLDSWDGTGNTLVVGNVLIRVQWDVEVDL